MTKNPKPSLPSRRALTIQEFEETPGNPPVFSRKLLENETGIYLTAAEFEEAMRQVQLGQSTNALHRALHALRSASLPDLQQFLAHRFHLHRKDDPRA